MDRTDARDYLAAAIETTAAMRASSGFRGFAGTALLVLFTLSAREPLTVEQLAERIGVGGSTMSAALTALRASGHVREESCSKQPELCSAHTNGRACGKHHHQWLTEHGHEVVEDWAKPFIRLLRSTDRRFWPQLPARLRAVSATLARQPAKRDGAARSARATPPKRAA